MHPPTFRDAMNMCVKLGHTVITWCTAPCHMETILCNKVLLFALLASPTQLKGLYEHIPQSM
jgi:hypothetical protein